MTTFLDDLGYPVDIDGRPQRVVSLVPSLTEAVAESCPGLLVGATDWCTHPAALDVTRVRGTKNPDLAAVTALRPDLVICNQEENRRIDVDRMRVAGVTVWVTKIESLSEALVSLDRLFGLALGAPRPTWLDLAEATWAPEPTVRRTGVVPIWRDPWMVVGSRTFTGDLLDRLGIDNVFADSADRYPHVDLADIAGAGADLVLLPDEPYVFHAGDGPEAFPNQQVALVSGRLLTWYGPSLAMAREQLLQQLPT